VPTEELFCRWRCTLDLARPLAVITPTVDADVLAVLAGATASFSGRQVHRLVGRHSERGVRNTLQRLCAQGIVTRSRVGSADQYALNRAHLAAPYIEALATVRAELLQRIREQLVAWTLPAEYSAMFGSSARGEMRVDSDIDLFVVRPSSVDGENETWREQLSALADNVTGWTGNDARILEIDVREVKEGLIAKEGVLIDIREHGVNLAGPRGYLGRRNDTVRQGG